MDRTCRECGGSMADRSSRAVFCSPRCKDLARRVPCQRCGALKHTDHAGRRRGYVEKCHACIRETSPHGAARYNKHGCRCDVCKAANADRIREWARRHGYWSRPEVVARRHAYRSQIEIQVQASECSRAYYQANKDSARERRRRRDALKREATFVRFTPVELQQRLSMSGGRCWICKKRVGDDFHVDHVKPLSKGGPHMLANLRLACAPCNLSKNDRWPFVAA